VLKADSVPVPFFGALGKLVPTLGLPISRELLLGSAQRGRYQVYERGLSLGGIPERPQQATRCKLGLPGAPSGCRALVAFDIRGFTKWSVSGVTAQQIKTWYQGSNSFSGPFSGKW
jgi:hypothetical protein